jgi:FK506-binding protein 8
MDVLGNRQLLKKVVKTGEGITSRPDRGYEVTVAYKMKLESGEVVEEITGLTFTVGDADVVQGLDLAMPLTELHEVAELSVDARFGYGTLGRKPDIPPGARLLIELHLLDVQSPLEPENMDMAERLQRGNRKREKGNWWYTREDIAQAIQCYRKSLDFIDDGEATFHGTDAELQQALDMRLKVYNNLAAAQLKMEAHDAALKSVENVLRLQPNNVKALFRKSKILTSKGQTEDAMTCLRKAIKLEPDNKTLQQDLNKLSSKYKTEVQSERDMYKRMLGNKQEQHRNKQHKSTSTWSMIVGGIAAVLVGIVAFRQYHA